MAGQLVVFEGPDGGGKSTLAAKLEEALVAKGIPTQLAGFPSRTQSIGRLIRSGLTGEVTIDRRAYLFLMIADGIDWETRIEEWTKQGGVFLADRHTTFSAFVYQTEDLPEATVTAAFGCYPWKKPDMTFLVDVPAALSMERRKNRTGPKDVVMERDDLAYNERIRRKYLTLFAQYDGLYTLLDGTLPTDKLVEQCLHVLGHR